MVKGPSGKSLSLEVDLANVGPVVTLFDEVFNGTQSSTWAVSGQGRVKLSLVKNAALDFTLGLAALSNLKLTLTPSDGVARVSELGASDPLYQVHVANPTRTATLTVGLHDMHFTGLLKDLGIATDTELPADAFVSGFTGNLIVDDAGARLEQLGLGGSTSSLRTGSTVLISGDFNTDLGRAVNVTWANATDGFQLTARPGISLDATFNLEAVTGMNFHPIEEFRHVHYTTAFTSPGSAPSVVVITQRSSSSSNAVLRLVEGTWSIAADLLSPCTGSDNVAACNAFKTAHTCGGQAPVLDCATFSGNSCWNAQYFDCLGWAWDCGSGAFPPNAAEQASSCTPIVSGPVAPRSFSAPSCLAGASSRGTNVFVQGFVASACP